MTIKADLEQIKADLTTQRDEMKVKIGLAKLDIKQEWQAAEDKTEQFFESIHNMTQDTKEELFKSTKQLGDELKKPTHQLKRVCCKPAQSVLKRALGYGLAPFTLNHHPVRHKFLPPRMSTFKLRFETSAVYLTAS